MNINLLSQKTLKFYVMFLCAFTMSACMGKGDHNPVNGGKALSPSSGSEQSSKPGSSDLTFATVKEKIFIKCQACHGAGSINGNWGDYSSVKAKIDRMIDRVLVKKDMPLGFKLADEELALLKKWIEAGAPEGSQQPADPNPAPNPNPTPNPAPTPEPNPTPTPNPNPEPVPPVGFDATEAFNTSCSSCHGKDSVALQSPQIFGLGKDYLNVQLLAFKNDVRSDQTMFVMNSVVKQFSDENIMKLSEYISKLNSCDMPKEIVNPEGGDVKAGQSSVSTWGCMGCHSAGNAMNAPVLDGQKTSYIKAQLSSFKNGTRKSDIMAGMAAGLSDGEMLNIGAYLNSLRSCQ